MTSKELRSRAEDAVMLTRRDVSALTKHDVQRLVYELQVHQIELEMQNESLRSAQRAVETSQAQYEELFECAPVGYLLVDATGVIARTNLAGATLLRVSARRLIGQPLAGFVAAEDVLVLHEHLRRVQQDSRANCEMRLRGPRQAAVHVRLDTSVVPEPVSHYLMVLTDISERKQSVEALERLNHELEARVASRTVELESRNRELESEILCRTRSDAKRRDLESRLRASERLESLGLLAAGIAHDFNNLLVSVLGNADLMLQLPERPDGWQEPLSLIKRASRDASDLTRQLLVFAGRGQLSTAAINLARVVAESVGLLRTQLSASVRLQIQLDPDLPAIEADRGQVHQVVMNLVTNAAEAVDGSGEITIQMRDEELDAVTLTEFQHPIAAQPGRFVVLEVKDSGPGIDAVTLDRIFDPFFTTKFTGRGLGLATTLGIVHGHGGALRVRSNPGKGTSFEVAFPLALAQRYVEPAVERSETAWTGSGSVLLIDDDDGVRGVVARLLTWLGFEVTAADGGEAGLELHRLAASPFSFVVLDWLMPGTSGAQVLKTLREREPQLPVILISGYSTEDLATHDERVVRVQKPMTLVQLQDAIRQVLGNSGAIEQARAS